MTETRSDLDFSRMAEVLSKAVSIDGESPKTMSTRDVKNNFSAPKRGLLDLPVEVLTVILNELSSETLQVLLDVHPIFAIVVKQTSFLSRHTRRELQLPDDDATFDKVPKSFSPQLELWYFTNAKATACRSRRKRSPHVPIMDRSSFFFPLVCFKHTYRTWLAQAGGYDIIRHNNNSSHSAENNFTSRDVFGGVDLSFPSKPRETNVAIGVLLESAHVLLDERPPALPSYVTQALTKLFLVLPDFLENSLYAQHLSLHRGYPSTLAHTWEICVHPKLLASGFLADFKPWFSLEILCGESKNERAGVGMNVNAILILFSPEMCTIWLGTVSPFLACKHGGTKKVFVFDVDSSLSSLKKEVDSMADMFEKGFGREIINNHWMLQKLFPGVCHSMHFRDRNDISIALDSKMELLAQQVQSQLSKLRQNQNNSSRRVILAKLQAVMTTFGVKIFFRKPKFPTHKKTRAQKIVDLNKTTRNRETYSQLLQGIQSGLHKAFASEVHYFFSNRKSHVITCNVCSKLWFPLASTLDDCISRSLESSQLPLDQWPYHLTMKALEMLEGAVWECAKVFE